MILCDFCSSPTRQQNYYSAGSRLLNTDNYDFRVDYNVSSNRKVFARYSHRLVKDYPAVLFPRDLAIAEGRINEENRARNAVVDYTHTVSLRNAASIGRDQSEEQRLTPSVSAFLPARNSDQPQCAESSTPASLGDGSGQRFPPSSGTRGSPLDVDENVALGWIQGWKWIARVLYADSGDYFLIAIGNIRDHNVELAQPGAGHAGELDCRGDTTDGEIHCFHQHCRT